MKSARSKKGSRRKLRLVIIDDSAPTRGLIADALAQFSELEIVGQAEDGRQGLQLIRDLKPDVVTLDLRMPKMSGLELLRVLQAEKTASRVLVLAALPAEEIRNKCLALGVEAVFDKTSEFQNFLETVRRLCPPRS